MLRLSNNSRVRRRLFEADDLIDQAKVDNFANILQESLTRDRIAKSQKWNFDFEKEIPLEGTYQWYPCNETADWIGVKSEKDNDNKEGLGLSMKMENEATPRARDGEILPLLRKRRSNVDVKPDTKVKRKISFD
ncbi:uncharacterized protein LOC126776933 [Nymphalis io]|uniref:uncharacterized protein LOC126776933 n=1 Tax=Inachis io TaxID=171585 RepID=UPI002169CE8A|nr:uncharacterized protein LOC126776933 [Nymphalis io]XP_050355759.1 uncharacterized protein LOC126776933 [Nymphalis io]XP_050355760.1 uncharacterized protein LOC126776933 [Nymphalis io]XP_050355761.1 uncharacterized protein LOC126776933 [Nymphalis io]